MNIYGDGTLLFSYCIVIISLVNKTIQFNLKHMSLEFQMSLQNVENRIEKKQHTFLLFLSKHLMLCAS